MICNDVLTDHLTNINFFLTGISLLDKEVRTQVLQNHADLVFQATWMERLESLITDMHSQIQVCYKLCQYKSSLRVINISVMFSVSSFSVFCQVWSV